MSKSLPAEGMSIRQPEPRRFGNQRVLLSGEGPWEDTLSPLGSRFSVALRSQRVIRLPQRLPRSHQGNTRSESASENMSERHSHRHRGNLYCQDPLLF